MINTDQLSCVLMPFFFLTIESEPFSTTKGRLREFIRVEKDEELEDVKFMYRPYSSYGTVYQYLQDDFVLFDNYDEKKSTICYLWNES